MPDESSQAAPKTEAAPAVKNRTGQSQDEAFRADRARLYWRENVRFLTMLLAIWFLVSFGAGILFVEPLNAISLGGYPLGFWFAQQGSIYVFVALIFYYS